MGNHFEMSFRFNKKIPEDFGLTKSERSDIFIKHEDNSLWMFRRLYDYGWGKENGFYKIPLPEFNQLCSIILDSNNDDDKYGAATIILDDFADQLLEKCFELFETEKDIKKYTEFFEILRLQIPINRSATQGKNCSQIAKDHERWEALASKVKKLFTRKH